METHISVTPKVAQILKVFLEDVDQPRYGFELMQLTRQPSGTTYPILATLERAGWIESRQEDIDPSKAGRPRRRIYVITPNGAALAAAKLEWQSPEIVETSLCGDGLLGPCSGGHDSLFVVDRG